MTSRHLALMLALAAPLHSAMAATCVNEDHEVRVSGASQCLLMRRFGSLDPDVMVVWLHGDVSSGLPANYHFAIAQEAATQLSSLNVVSVALVRPGYSDGTGESSSVSLPPAMTTRLPISLEPTLRHCGRAALWHSFTHCPIKVTTVRSSQPRFSTPRVNCLQAGRERPAPLLEPRNQPGAPVVIMASQRGDGIPSAARAQSVD